MDITSDIVSLYLRISTSLPEDIHKQLMDQEESELKCQMKDNLNIAKKKKVPICQDTGTPVFLISHDKSYDPYEIDRMVHDATILASKKIPLRKNAVVSDKPRITGPQSPIIYHEKLNKGLRIKLMLKGGGSENIGRMYKLPDRSIDAYRNLDGIRRCVLDACIRAQGKGCPPYLIGVCIGGSRDVVTKHSKLELFRQIDDKNEDLKLDNLEAQLTSEINSLSVGMMGLGRGKTCLGVKIKETARHPATFFVDVSFSCWVSRKGEISYDT